MMALLILLTCDLLLKHSEYLEVTNFQPVLLAHGPCEA